MWSILPAAYISHFAYFAHTTGVATSRIDLITAVGVLWSMRLTFNYWRKGGYSYGSEDYRWEVIKEKIGRPAFFVLNITFISWMQNWLLLSVATPVYLFVLVSKSFPAQEGSFSLVDVGFATTMLTVLFTEFNADNQQWSEF